MFYSHLLLSKKGPLGTVWIAAHCHKRLKKDQITQTDISSSVDKILHDGVPVATYRILAYLLLGVVRIYSKKVEYLFHESQDIVARLNELNIGKTKGISIRGLCIGGMRAPHHSITFPKSFELDAFDLEVEKDQAVSDGNGSSRENLMLTDDRRTESNTVDQPDQGHHMAIIPFSDAYSSAYTPDRDVFSPQPVCTSLILNPSHNMSNSVTSMEIFRGSEFFLEDRLDPMILDEDEFEQGHDRLSNDQQDISKDLAVVSLAENLEENEPNDLAGPSSENNDSLDAEQTRLTEMTILDSRGFQMIADCSRSVAVNITSDLKDPGESATPDMMAIRTPAPRERPKGLRKRRQSSFDDSTIISNNVYKQWLADPSDIVRKRKKAPRTVLQGWRAEKHSNLQRGFKEPLFSGSALDVQSIQCKRILPAEPTVEAFANQDEAGSSITPKFGEQIPVAPAAPLTHSASLVVHESCGVTEILEPLNSIEIQEKGTFPSEDLELDVTSVDEGKSSSRETGRDRNLFSTRTKSVAKFLLGNFVEKKRNNDEPTVNLSEVVQGKTKKESARLFYEILVLKTGKCIDVKQEKPYDDIILRETPVLGQSLEPQGQSADSEGVAALPAK